MDCGDIGINIASYEGVSESVTDSGSALREVVGLSGQEMSHSDTHHVSRPSTASSSDLTATRHERRRRKSIRKADVTSLIEAVKASGLGVSGIKFDTINGNFTVFTGKPESAPEGALANWKQRRAR